MNYTYTHIRSEEHTSELQSHRDLHSFPTRRSSDLSGSAASGRSSSRYVSRCNSWFLLRKRNHELHLHTYREDDRPLAAEPDRSEERRVGKECRSRCDWSSDVCSSDLICV